MTYEVVEDVLSAECIEDIYSKYYQITESDESSHYAWDQGVTRNREIPAAYTTQILSRDRMMIANELYTRTSSPFYKMKSVIHCDIAAYKYPVGCWVPFHIDTCMASLTLFLNRDWTESQGGCFQWYDSENKLYAVVPRFNTGVSLVLAEQSTSPEHGVTVVCGAEHRFSLQIFMRKPGDVAIKYRNRL